MSDSHSWMRLDNFIGSLWVGLKIQNMLNYKQKYIWGITFIIGIMGINSAKQYLKNKQLSQQSLKKREQCHKQLQQYKQMYHQPSSLSQQLQIQILNSNISQLKQLLNEREVTVKQLLQVFIDRVLKVACFDKLNLITEINFLEALKEADLQDQEIIKDPQIIYKFPLFGIPISIKETLIMKGFDSTIGLGDRCFKPSLEDGTQVCQIRLAKGIIFVRTNIPQLAMTFESINPVYGRSLNPWNVKRAVGGSSGGEGAMAAAKCSVVGLGSDIGGSIRIPCAFCGVYGLKPTTQRIPDQGEAKISQAFYGLMQLRISRGPIARCVDDLIVVTKVLLDKQLYSQIPYQIRDPYFQPQELQELPQNKKLKIGYFEIFDNFIPPNCMKRAVKEACLGLQSKGHEIVKFQIDPQIQHLIASCFMKIMTSDGGMKSVVQALNGENYIKEHDLLIMASKIPLFIKKYVLGPLFKLFGQQTLFHYNETGKVSIYQYLIDSGQRKQTNLQFIQQMYDQGLDAIICPGFALPAVKHGSSRMLGFATLYTWIWNTLDLPAGSMPITLVKDGDDQIIEGKQKTFDIIYREMNKNMIGSEGLPVNIQVISYPNQEEMVLKVMKDIEEVVNFNQKHPYPELEQ